MIVVKYKCIGIGVFRARMIIGQPTAGVHSVISAVTGKSLIVWVILIGIRHDTVRVLHAGVLRIPYVNLYREIAVNEHKRFLNKIFDRTLWCTQHHRSTNRTKP